MEMVVLTMLTVLMATCTQSVRVGSKKEFGVQVLIYFGFSEINTGVTIIQAGYMHVTF